MKIINKILKTNYFNEFKRSKYYNYYKKQRICNNNIFVMCCDEKTIKLLESNTFKNYNVFSHIKRGSLKYFKLLSNCKYIITDNTIDNCYIKKDNQIVITLCNKENEYLGRNSKDDYFDIGSLQRTLMNSDYIIFSNEKIKELIIRNYMLENILTGKIICKNNILKIFEQIILNKNNNARFDVVKNNGKQNILIYAGNLARNGITSSLKNLLMNVDINDKNYYIVYDVDLAKDNKEQLLDLKKEINYIAIDGNTNMSLFQKIKLLLFRSNILPINKDIDKLYKLDIKRLFPNMIVSDVIQFGGYDFRKILLFSSFDCNKIIYVHSNMLDEIKTRKIQHRPTLEYAYNVYNKVAIVSDTLFESTSEISKRKDNIFIANNIIDYKSIIKKSKQDIKFDSFTESNIELNKLIKILNSDSKKFITIGRFSKEKGHERLINSFNKLYLKNKNIHLIIIGGKGDKYSETLNLAKSLESKDNIILIKNMSNPYSVLGKCDYFVLPSYYEGFGLVLAEADILDIPVISTNIDGPKKFMEKNNGVMVENSEEGIYNGMERLLKGEIKPMKVDYDKYNEEALKGYYSLLGDKNEK